MTKEKILQTFEDINLVYNNCTRYDTLKRMLDELQEPCEDCISRQAVLNILDDMVKDYIKENDFDKAQGVAWVKVQKLPPVTPQPKTGRWIEHFDESGKWYECDQCHTDWGGPVNYCPNCGKKM